MNDGIPQRGSEPCDFPYCETPCERRCDESRLDSELAKAFHEPTDKEGRPIAIFLSDHAGFEQRVKTARESWEVVCRACGKTWDDVPPFEHFCGESV